MKTNETKCVRKVVGLIRQARNQHPNGFPECSHWWEKDFPTGMASPPREEHRGRESQAQLSDPRRPAGPPRATATPACSPTHRLSAQGQLCACAPRLAGAARRPSGSPVPGPGGRPRSRRWVSTEPTSDPTKAGRQERALAGTAARPCRWEHHVRGSPGRRPGPQEGQAPLLEEPTPRTPAALCAPGTDLGPIIWERLLQGPPDPDKPGKGWEAQETRPEDGRAPVTAPATSG